MPRQFRVERQNRDAMLSMMEHIADCERRGRLARPPKSATRDALERQGLIQEQPAPKGSRQEHPHWVLTNAGRSWL